MAERTEGDEGIEVAKTGGTPPTLRGRRLSYWYGSVIGINDISVDIGAGVTGLLGPNGAGKSTLLKVLTGQLRPSTGVVTMQGEPLWNNAEAFQKMGLVPEQDAFYWEMTGLEFVTYLTRLQGFDEEDAAALAGGAIETVGLTDDRARPVSEYSKGMRQRLKCAQAIAHDPEVVVLDEPLNGTDPVGRHAMIELIRELGDRGKTVLVSSHVLDEVERMTSEILLIHKGRVLAEGNIYEIRELIDEHPHSILVMCDQPRAFAGDLLSFDDIVQIEFLEGGFRVATSDPNACYDRIPKLALDRNYDLRSMSSPDNDLSAVFQYLVE